MPKTETDYVKTELEALAVVWALKRFRDLVYGYPVNVLTDHVSGVELFRDRDKLPRWCLKEGFNPTFEYLEGKSDTTVDALPQNVSLVLPDTSSR